MGGGVRLKTARRPVPRRRTKQAPALRRGRLLCVKGAKCSRIVLENFAEPLTRGDAVKLYACKPYDGFTAQGADRHDGTVGRKRGHVRRYRLYFDDGETVVDWQPGWRLDVIDSDMRYTVRLPVRPFDDIDGAKARAEFIIGETVEWRHFEHMFRTANGMSTMNVWEAFA
jgi:hypothetical protein